MPSLSGDSEAGLKPAGAAVFVLRLESGIPGPHILEIGFGTAHIPNQAGMKDHSTSDPSLQVSVAFPWSGETRTYSASLMDGSKPASSARRKGEQLLAFSLDVLAPFEFSGLAYDPLGSIAASVARLAAEDPGQSNDCLMALWAALESDLYRFAKDSGFTAAVDVAARDQPVEYRRFAQLNNLYRDLVELLVPYGQAPRRWTAWLRGQEYHPVLPASLALRMERLLAGRAGQPGIALDSLTRLLAGYGAVVMQPLP